MNNPTTKENWEAYWQYYEAADYVNYTPQLLSTIQQYVDLHGANVLEVGSGTGGNASELARLGANVTTIDFSISALKRTLITGENACVQLTALQADARSLPLAANNFDLIYHQGFLEHFIDPEIFLREQRRVLTQNGYLLVDVPQLFNWYTIYKMRLIRSGRWPYGGWERQFSLSELNSLLIETGFQPVCAYGRGYFPRPFAILRNLGRIARKLMRRSGPPSRIERSYDNGWRRFEQSWLGCNTLQCVGVLAQAVGEV